MTVFRVLDEHVLTEAEYRAMAPVLGGRAQGALESTVDLGLGRALATEAPPAVADFVPIAIGTPLTVQIRHVYTGQYPRPGLLGFGGAKDIAVVSGVRDYSVFAATARALNFVQRNVRPNSHLEPPSAFSEGTPIVVYQSAITADSLTLSIELAADNFDADLVTQFGSALESLAGVPLLLPYAGYVLGAGEIIKLGAGIANGLFDGKPAFSITEALNFDVPGAENATADFRILTYDQTLPVNYSYDDKQGLVDRRTGELYDGDEPYVVVSLDGRPRPNLEAFAPTAASASILRRFFNLGADVRTPIDTIVEGIKLASDMRFRNQALTVKAAMDKLPAAGADHAKLQAQYDALVKNIGNPLLAPQG
jgi:hypothetical protein